jgi:hypothetical protein
MAPVFLDFPEMMDFTGPQRRPNRHAFILSGSAANCIALPIYPQLIETPDRTESIAAMVRGVPIEKSNRQSLGRCLEFRERKKSHPSILWVHAGRQ